MDILKNGLVLIFLSMMLVTIGCNTNNQVHMTAQDGAYIVAADDKVTHTKSGSVALRIVKSISGSTDIKYLYIQPFNRKLFLGAESRESKYFLRIYNNKLDYTNMFIVYGIASDRYAALRDTFKDMKIDYYTNDFSVDMLWVPASCNIDVVKCQLEVNLIAQAVKSKESG